MAQDSSRGAARVAAGILLSRLVGLARQKLFAVALGNGTAAAAFAAALRIPNVLQNLLGEGVLSASFIPAYASLRAKGDDAAADRLAGAVFGLLSLVVGALVAAGLLAAPLLVRLIAPGFQGEAQALTVQLVRIIFPGTGLLVMSAWCLGILNSHRRFFLSYAAPVLWNGAIIAALLAFRGRAGEAELAAWVAWGTVVGAVAQVAVQLPNVRRLLGTFRPSLGRGDPHTREVVRNFVPAVGARGVVQVSAYLDTVYASLLAERAVAALSYAQAIALLPVSLFGMSISAAELPELSAEAAGKGDGRDQALRERLRQGLDRVAFFVVPSAAGLALLGDLICGVLLEGGRFTPADSRFTGYLLTGSAVGLLAQTSGRLYASTLYALKDTRTPFKLSALRVALAGAAAFLWVRYLPGALGVPAYLGAVGITATTGLSAWLEQGLLRRAVGRAIGPVGPTPGRVALLWACAAAAAAAAVAAKYYLLNQYGPAPGVAEEWGGWLAPAPAAHPVLSGALVLATFSLVYGVATYVLGVPQAQALLGRVVGRLRRR